ncbi:MAG TPA: alpha/beta hydrolase [Candidatus Binataceae bacterium]|nr:alpha/beta hydrolase [Candidatus Binataceae bacterium]
MATTRDYAPAKDGVKLRYEIRGSGDPLALIMGFSGSSHGWGEPFVRGMEARFRTVLIDNRGTGESDKPDVPWTLATMADDIAAVLDHAKIPRAHIYGISMGGMIAQEFALRHASRVRGLVLGCTAPGMAHGAPTDPANVAKLIPQPGMSPEEAARVAFSVACGTKFLNSKHGQDFINQQLADTYPVTPMHTFTRQMEAIQGWDSYEQLPQIKAPTMIIHGDDDRLLPHANADILHKRIAGSKVHIMKDIGHMFFWEAPEESVRVPGDFIAPVK